MSMSGGADTVLLRTAVDPSGATAGLEKLAKSVKSTGDAAEKAFSGQATAGLGKFGGAVDSLKGKFGGLTEKLKEPALAKGVLQGVGFGAGAIAFGGITKAIESGAEMLGDFVKAGAQAEATDAKLTTSLKANVPNWQAHNDEIESAARAAEKLGFEDDNLKDSLAAMVLHTHDVTKALQVERVAMDLARFKHIDLEAASTALGKAYDGNTTALKKMGIEVPKGVKGLEAIGAVQKAVAGQAEAFANTYEGQQEALSASIEAVKEKLGTALLPAFKTIIAFITDYVVPGIQNLIDGIGNLGTAFDNLHRFIDPTYAHLEDLRLSLVQEAQQYGYTADDIQAYIDVQKAAIVARAAAAVQIAQANHDNAATVAAMQAEQDALKDDVTLRRNAIDMLQQDRIEQNRLTQQQMVATAQTQQQTKALAEYTDGVDRHTTASEGLITQTQRQSEAWQRQQRVLSENGDGWNHLAFEQKKAAAALGQYGEIVTTTLPAATKAVDKATTRMAFDFASLIPKVKRDAASIGTAFPNGIKAGLEANVRAVALASQNLHYAIKHPLAILNAKGGFGWLVGQATSKGLLDGLNSNQAEVVAAAEAKRQAIVDALSEMPSYAWGSKIGQDYIQGLEDAGLIRHPNGWGVKWDPTNPFYQYPTGGGGHTRGSGGNGGHNQNIGTGSMPPLRMGLPRNGMAWQSGGGTINHTGTVTHVVRVDGTNLSPAAAREIGRGIGESRTFINGFRQAFGGVSR